MDRLDALMRRRLSHDPDLKRDEREMERAANIAASARDFGYGYAGTLPDGVPWGAPDFDAFLAPPAEKALHEEKEAVIAWVAGSGSNLLTLAGPPGVGKTHLAGAAAIALVESGAQVIYRSEHNLLEDYRPHGNPEEAEYAYREIPWLIIDDLGLEALTGWGKSIMDQLVDARWMGAAAGLRTLITTNLLSKDLPPRVASRLGDRSRARVIQVAAGDFRRRG
mgnify:CR=1 FL=1